MMKELNLPPASLKIIQKENKVFVFDNIRKKYIQLTEEEWVRQNFIQYLCNYKQYPASLIAVEKALKVNKLQRRTDIVVYDKAGKAKIIVECKAPSVKLSNATYTQAARYNLMLRANMLVVTNGIQHFCSKIDLENKRFIPQANIPSYKEVDM